MDRPDRSAPLFPLIRRISAVLSPRLVRTAVTPNQITTCSLLSGLGAAALLATGSDALMVAGALLLVLSYVCDNCDGEVARARNQSTRAGALFDSFADAVVHVVLFAALGWGMARASGDALWIWLGLCAAAGAAINSVIALARDLRRDDLTADPSAAPHPHGRVEWCIYALRELGRADFCFLLLACILSGTHGVLLAASAVGAHVYWLLALSRRVSRFRA